MTTPQDRPGHLAGHEAHSGSRSTDRPASIRPADESAQRSITAAGPTQGELQADAQAEQAAVRGEPVTVIVGRVGTWDDASGVRDALLDAGFASTDVETFYTGPAGRHAITSIGGDSQADAGSVDVGKGAAAGGIAGGAAGIALGAALAAVPVVGAVVLTAGALGAFGGALAGGVAATQDGSGKTDTEEHPVAKAGGVVIAVRCDRDPDGEARALRCLRDAGAIALERAQGRWHEGSWVDWDPVGVREQIAPEPGTPQA
jgi:hypothetical protein